MERKCAPSESQNVTGSDTRPFVNIPIVINNRKIPTKWLLDTGSQISIISSHPNQGMAKKWIEIQGVNAAQKVPMIEVVIDLYNTMHKIMMASFAAPANILGINEIRELFPSFLNNKKIKKISCNLAEVKVEPVVLPAIKPSFTPQYPIKGGIKEITETLKDLIKEGVITQTQSFNYNSPVWPVLKPNGKWRFTVDYRRVNELSPKMPGSLPDVEGIFLRIRQEAPKWLATIDLPDMFFGIPLHPLSQEITTFTWQNKQYKFLRLPQGYINSPIIAHTALMKTLEDLEITDATMVSYVDDLLVYGQDKDKVQKALDKIIQHLRDQGWTINQDKVQGPSEQVKFLGVHWSTTRPKIPEEIINKLKTLKEPQNKTDVQHLIGLFGYWRQHIPYLQLILKPLYSIIKKAQDFTWGEEQKQAV